MFAFVHYYWIVLTVYTNARNGGVILAVISHEQT